MLKQASIGEIRSGKLTRKDGYLVAGMAFYPRGLKKELLDEYRTNLAPDKQLFKEWQAAQEKVGHEAAFAAVHYEERFTLDPSGLESLRRLVDISRKQDVFIACQCGPGERCHREIVLLIAQAKFGADIAPLNNEYPEILKRLKT